jgi:hypothetical protein
MSTVFKYPCWCAKGLFGGLHDPDPDHQLCGGTGWVVTSRIEAMWRDKVYLGYEHPKANKQSGYEKFVRVAAEIPPEVMEELDRVHRRVLGVNASSATRAGLIRAALLTYWDRHEPEVEYTDAEAQEITDVQEEISQGGSEHER